MNRSDDVESLDSDNEQEPPSIEEQEARAFLRERFLRLVSHLQGKDCEIHTHGDSTVKCKIRSFEPSMENIIVDNLQTPTAALIQKAVLRSEDIKSMHFKLDESSFINTPDNK